MAAETVALRRYRWPEIAIGRFVARRTLRAATLWALVFGAYVASKAAGYAAAYPTEHARAVIANTFGSNIGLAALLGRPQHMDTVVGFAVWNTLGVMTLVGAIWAFLLATKLFRGEEEAGRSELLLAGQTTAGRAAANTLAGLGVSVVALYVVTALTFMLVGALHSVHFGLQAALFFALAACMGAAVFLLVGAVASQLMPTRSRAAGLSALVLGVAFLLRATADTTSAHWLLNFTPLGWIEQLQPLYGSQPQWLVPLFASIVVLVGLTVFLASRRDLGASTFADKNSARPRFKLLRTPLGLGFRLTRASSVAWLLAVSGLAMSFGLMTKLAQDAFAASSSAANVATRFTTADTHAQLSTGTFLGILFLLIMTVIMCYTASSAGALRETEAQGYLDNLLVRPVGRLQWLGGRVFLVLVVMLLAGLLSGLACWIGVTSQHAHISFTALILAGLNTLGPALLTLGIGLCAFGVVPRFTILVAYGSIAWSFLIEMVGSGINLNHWLLDTSILHHVALAPAVNPRWDSALLLAGIGLGLAAVGAWRFRSRDLQSE